VFCKGVKLGLSCWRKNKCRCCFRKKIWDDNRNCVRIINGKVINKRRGTHIGDCYTVWARMAIHVKEYEIGKTIARVWKTTLIGGWFSYFLPPFQFVINQSVQCICIHEKIEPSIVFRPLFERPSFVFELTDILTNKRILEQWLESIL